MNDPGQCCGLWYSSTSEVTAASTRCTSTIVAPVLTMARTHLNNHFHCPCRFSIFNQYNNAAKPSEEMTDAALQEGADIEAEHRAEKEAAQTDKFASLQPQLFSLRPADEPTTINSRQSGVLSFAARDPVSSEPSATQPRRSVAAEQTAANEGIAQSRFSLPNQDSTSSPSRSTTLAAPRPAGGASTATATVAEPGIR